MTRKRLKYSGKERHKTQTRLQSYVWVDCFQEYLAEKNLPACDDIPIEDLPDVLYNFYTEVCKKKPGKSDTYEYKNSTLKYMRAGLNRHFKETKTIDIIAGSHFIKANKMFKGVTRLNKEEGRGEVESMPSINPEDMKTLGKYFEENMAGPPNALLLQEIILFNIIYYMGKHGRENLRRMKINMFGVSTDPDGKYYIHQLIKEKDKNHKENYMSPNNEARVYEIPGNNFFSNHL